MNNCKLVANKGVQDKQGYHLAFTCATCNATGLFLNQDKNNIQFDEDFVFDKTKYHCPNSEYEQNKQSQKDLTKLQVRKGSVVKINTGTIGEIIKYSSNLDIVIKCKETETTFFNLQIIKIDIVEVITL